MADKRLEIHPSALAEMKSALNWYLARSEAAARKFAVEVDRATGMVVESPGRWPIGEHGARKIVLRRFRLPSSTGRNKTRFSYWPLPTGTDGLSIGETGCSNEYALLTSRIKRLGV